MAKKFICLQAGHQNTKNQCIVSLRGSTGAPGEVENNIRIRDRLSQILLSKKNADGSDAFMIQLVDSCFNCDPKSDDTDFDFFLSLHCESDTHKDSNGNSMDGGMISPPDPSVDYAKAESKRICDAIASEYFNHAGITQRPGWITNNMTYYYMWASLSAKTPCGLLEMGVAQNPHDKVILADTDRVANAIARGICRAFNVPFDVVSPTPTPTPTPTITDDTVIPQIDNKRVKDIKKDLADKDKALLEKDGTISTLNDKIRKGREALA